jgi:hypothetical protein
MSNPEMLTSKISWPTEDSVVFVCFHTLHKASTSSRTLRRVDRKVVTDVSKVREFPKTRIFNAIYLLRCGIPYQNKKNIELRY